MELCSRGSLPDTLDVANSYQVLLIHGGHWRLRLDGAEHRLAPGDTCALPPGVRHAVTPAQSGEAALMRVPVTDDPAGPTRLSPAPKSRPVRATRLRAACMSDNLN